MIVNMKLTKNRLALLQAVADGAVSRCYERIVGPPIDDWDDISRTPRHQTVTGRIRELELAGLVTLSAMPARYRAPRLWILTEFGGTTLEEAGGAR